MFISIYYFFFIAASTIIFNINIRRKTYRSFSIKQAKEKSYYKRKSALALTR